VDEPITVTLDIDLAQVEASHGGRRKPGKSRNNAKCGLPSSDISGEWIAQWFLTGEENTPAVQDQVEIQVLSDFEVVGKGGNKYGKYIISGKFTRKIITLMYEHAYGQAYAGVLYLVLADNGESCEGEWRGYRPDGSYGGGIVRWNRLEE
jgi:hypothetical protein